MSHTLTTPTKPAASATTPRPTEKVRCKCSHLAKRLTSRSEKNPGRVFYQCYKGRDDPETCKFFVWEDMIPGTEPPTEPKSTGTSPAAARYNATLAAKASPIPRLGNYVKASTSSREGYTYTLPGASPLKPITSIPHPPHPAVHRCSVNAATDAPRPPTTDEEVPVRGVGARGNSAERRAIARERRDVAVHALQGRTSDDSLSNDEEEEISGPERASTDGDGEPESIEAFESVPLAHKKDGDRTRRSDGFDDDDDDGGIAWAHVDADEMEARASQALAETPRPVQHDIARREIPRAPPYVAQMETPPGATFIDRLKAVTTRDAPGSTKKRKREHLEHERPSATGNPASEGMMDGTSTPSFVSARGTLTPPETERRRDLGAFSSATDLQGSASAVSVPSVLSGNGSTSVHPLLQALNKDLVRRDRRAAADEKSREMLRGRVKALEGRVRELEAELRRAKSGL